MDGLDAAPSGTPSQAQSAGLGLLQGLAGGFGQGLEEEQKTARANALQKALEDRQAAKDARAAIPKEIYGPLWEKTTGLKLPDSAPATLSPQLGVSMFGNNGRMYGADQTRAGREYGADQTREGREYAADQTNEGVHYKTDHPPAKNPQGDHAAELKDAKLYQMGQAAVIKALGHKYANGSTPPLNQLGPEDVDLANATFAAAVGPGYRGGQFMDKVAGQPGTGLHGFLGMGSAAVPAASRVLPPKFGALAGALTQGAQPQQQQALDPAVADGIRKARAIGWDDDKITATLAAKGHQVSPADLASVK